ncbi:MAG TPA: branched-chain amino acid ABC transporter permease/ATP-binding protein [Jatrophihabitantaceae bacterium]|nr:branched-chain amino acid ABC transporter permease/ATP-binding protein [Jatrophihabitantaceae bacterium]
MFTDIAQFAILGLSIGALYGLEALGVVLTYRASGTLNFAQGAVGMVGAIFFYQFWQDMQMPWGLALVLAVAIGAILGIAIHLLVMRPLRRASPIARLLATLGVLIGLQYGMAAHYGVNLRLVPTLLPNHKVDLHGGLSVGLDRIVILAIGVFLTILLGVVYRHTRYGLRTSAVSENDFALAALGRSPNFLAAANWGIGGALAVVVAILIAPIVGLDVTSLSMIVLPAIAAAIVGGFSSFAVTFVAALGMGIVQSEVIRFVPVPGLSDAIPFLAIIALVVLKGNLVPLRSERPSKMPEVGPLRMRPSTIIGLCVVLALAITLLPIDWVDALTSSMVLAVILLSSVVLTGFCGQISLAQLVLAGVGGWIAGSLVAFAHFPFEIAAIAGIIGCVLVGVVVGLPAVRTRGVNLAIVTLGLGSVIEHVVLTQPSLTGGVNGTVVGRAHIFGIDVNSIAHSQRYAVVAAVVLLVLLFAVTNLGRSQTGRRMMAVRSNERAAAALGIEVPRVKLLAFALAAGIAGIGGVLLAYRSPQVDFTQYSVLGSISDLLFAVIGGIGFVSGPLFGGLFSPSGVGFQPFVNLPEVQTVLMALTGLLLLGMLMLNPNGMAQSHNIGHLLGKLRRRKPAAAKPGAGVADIVKAAGEPMERVEAKALNVSGLSVRFGGVQALKDVSISVGSGEIVGLIGPNGAGKTTFIDAVTGFVKPSSGEIRLGAGSITSLSAARRVRKGISRSFQSLELFEDLSVLDNMRIVGQRRRWTSLLTDLFRPTMAPLSPSTAAALQEFGLVNVLNERPGGLPYGVRRLVAIARSLASRPSILLLDEPAAGLSAGERTELSDLITRMVKIWGLGVLLIDHDVELVFDICDRVTVLEYGSVIAEGTPAEVRSNPKVVSAYLGEVPQGDITVEGLLEPEAAAGRVSSMGFDS